MYSREGGSPSPAGSTLHGPEVGPRLRGDTMVFHSKPFALYNRIPSQITASVDTDTAGSIMRRQKPPTGRRATDRP